jgi:hypothetical protein
VINAILPNIGDTNLELAVGDIRLQSKASNLSMTSNGGSF